MYNNRLIIFYFLLISVSIITAEIDILRTSVLSFSPDKNEVNDEAVIEFQFGKSTKFDYQLIIYSDSKLIRSISGKFKDNEIVKQIRWNGLNNKKKKQKEGSYLGVLTITESDILEEISFNINLDLSRPEAVISMTKNILSPNYDGISDELYLDQSGSKELLWTGEILDGKNKVVRTFRWKNSKPKNFKWDGLSDYGRNARDGIYSYKLYSEDSAGNKSEIIEIENIIVDASAPRIKISVDNVYFSPNGDTIKDSINVKTVIGSMNKAKSYSCSLINDNRKEIIKLFDNNLNIKEFIIDGLKPDNSRLLNGFYTLLLTVEYENGFKAVDNVKIHLDRDAPKVSVNIETTPFYSKNNNNYGSIILNNSILDETIIEKWSFLIEDSKGTKLYFLEGKDIPETSIVWNSTNFKNDIYCLKFLIEDKNGNNYVFNDLVNVDINLIDEDNKLFFDVPPVSFDAYKKTILPEQYNFDSVLSIINNNPGYFLVLESHSYDDGTSKKLLNKLSVDRALFVKDILIKAGINKNRIRINAHRASNNVDRNVYFILQK